TKAALDKMVKLDSLLRESIRYHGITLVTLTRKGTKDVTLINGTFSPKGTLLAAAAYPTHHDETTYVNADMFDPFCFARMHVNRDRDRGKHKFVNTSVDYISFGHGTHAW
ncbi:cytochrome P450, partial [Dichomitus squalens]